MTKQIAIMQATAQHVKIAAPLFDAYRQFYQKPCDISAAEKFLAERLRLDQSAVFLAMDGTTAAGFCQLYPSFSSLALTNIWILNDLFISSEYRQMGIARKLLLHVAGWARDTHAKGLVLETQVTNVPAQRLYESLGWQRETEFNTYTFDLQ